MGCRGGDLFAGLIDEVALGIDGRVISRRQFEGRRWW